MCKDMLKSLTITAACNTKFKIFTWKKAALDTPSFSY